MARIETDPQGNIRIAFKLNGVRVRVKPEGGPFKDTKTNRAWITRDLLAPLSTWEATASMGGEQGESARKEIGKMFASSQALRHSAPMREDRLAATTVADLLQLVEDDYRLNGKRSLAKVLSALVRPREYFRGVLAADCDGAMMLRYRDERAQETSHKTHRLLARATINRELVVIRSAFSHGKKRGLVKEVPHFELFSEKDNARQGFFEHDEYLAVLKRLSPALKPVVQVLYTTGWRRGEVLGLNRHNLDLKANRLRLEVGTTKNMAGREFILTPELRAILVAQLERIEAIERRTGWKIEALWVYDDGSRVKNIRNAWQTAVKRAYKAGELRHANMLIHDFRRTVVRNLARANVPQEWAMRMTGHKTAGVYRRYSIMNDATAEATVQQYARFMKSQGWDLDGAPPMAPQRVVLGKREQFTHIEPKSQIK